MHWQRLDRDTTTKVINSVQSAENAGMFSDKTSEVQRARLSFYKDYSMYKVTNFASLPSFTFHFLSDGTFFHYLDGTEKTIHTVNDKGVLDLNQANIMDYLTFYLAQVGYEESDVIVVSNPSDMPLLDSLDTEAYDSVFNNYKAPEISEENGNFTVKTDLYMESHMVRGDITVTPKGRVTMNVESTDMQKVMKSPEAENYI